KPQPRDAHRTSVRQAKASRHDSSGAEDLPAMEGYGMSAKGLFQRTAIAAAAVAMLATAGVARGAEKKPSAPGHEASIQATARFFTGSSSKIGEFPGKLVCLRCDVNPSSDAKSQCVKEGHRHALQIDADPLLHPLLGASED